MAGIGFELRKVFQKDTLYSKIKGIIFASITTIGPTIAVLIMLFFNNFIFNFYGATESEKLFFSSSCMYLFLFCIIVSGATGTPISRYISDKIHDNQNNSISASMIGSSIIVGSISALYAGTICTLLYLKGNISIYYLISYYFLGIMLSLAYNLMLYISALKEYLKITYAFFIGVVIAVICFLINYNLFKIELQTSVLFSLFLAFFIINIILSYLVMTYFGKPGEKYFEFLSYFRKYPYLFGSSFLYILTLYLPNIVFWFFSELSTKVSIFSVAPAYDMAMFLGIFINLTTPVIFVVKVETKFFEKYQLYVGSLTSATFGTIEKHKKIMIRTLDIELFAIYEIQLIITIIFTCVGILFFPMLGFGGLVLNLFLLLGIGIYCTYIMYFTVVFLYYFDDQKGSLITTFIFFLTTLASTILALKLGMSYYSIPLLIGGICSWIFGFFRLKYLLKSINERLFCLNIL